MDATRDPSSLSSPLLASSRNGKWLNLKTHHGASGAWTASSVLLLLPPPQPPVGCASALAAACSWLLVLKVNAAVAASSDRRAPLLRRLVEGSLASVASSNLIRVDVHFRDPPKYFSLDQVAGRAVHTKFLENTEFLRLFAARYAHCFES